MLAVVRQVRHHEWSGFMSGPNRVLLRGKTLLSAGIAGALCAAGILCSCRRAETLPKKPPEKLIALGWNDFRLREYNRALRRFEAAARNSATGSQERLQALYGMATVWNLRLPLVDQDKKQAEKIYRQLIAEAPQSDLAAWSMLALARMKHLVPPGQNPDYDEVRRAYRQVIERYPDHLAAEEAFIYLQSTYVATLRPEPTRRAVEALKKFIREHPDSGFVSAAWSLLAVSYDTLDMQKERLDAELQALKTREVDPTNPFQENAWQYWNIATIAEFEVGDFETARKYYRKLIEEYPTDIRRYGCEKALKRMDEIEQRIRARLRSRQGDQG